jgi:two-component system response regulator FixJ
MSMDHGDSKRCATVYVVDDDSRLRDSISGLLSTLGVSVTALATAEELLDSIDRKSPTCVVLDVRLPGMSGLELMQLLKVGPCQPVVVMITGHGDVPMAVAAMRAGAFHFIEKPFDPESFLATVEEALQLADHIADRQEQMRIVADRFQSLTAREVQVLDLLVAGKPSKLIAHELGISTRTAEHHRSAVMKKMQARSLSHLVRLALDLSRSSHREPDQVLS